MFKHITLISSLFDTILISQLGAVQHFLLTDSHLNVEISLGRLGQTQTVQPTDPGHTLPPPGVLYKLQGRVAQDQVWPPMSQL